MWTDLLAAIALLLVIEGLMPFINPGALRRALIANGLETVRRRFDNRELVNALAAIHKRHSGLATAGQGRHAG